MNKNQTSQIKAILARQPNRTFKPKELARQLGIKQHDYPGFRDNLKRLAAQGQIARHKRNQYGLLRMAQIIEGEIVVKGQGYGFLLTEEDKEDIFVSQKHMGTALNRDIVNVELFAHSQGRSPEGRVVKIVKRAQSNIVGTYKKTRKYGFIVPDDTKINRDIYIHPGDALNAQPGQKVVVHLKEWTDERLNPEGEIVEVLGFPDEPGIDVISVVKSFDLPTVFPPNVEEEAKRIQEKISEREISRRLDLREQTCFTIDPEDAKDFDDAVSLRTLANGNLELGVHIADVSYYVQEKTALDKEALKRGTSVYLVDRVIPMLPEKLSNEICSLRPEEDKLTMSCLMEVARDGRVVNYRIGESVICSKRRFSYEQVQEIIGGQKGPHAEEIRAMHSLSKRLIQNRQQLGSLDFDLPEAKIQLDKKGVPIAIRKSERLDSHRLIEEFMLLANQTVTRHVARHETKADRIPPFIYRIHEPPAPEKMKEFMEFVKALGYQIDPNKKLTAKLLGRFLDSVQGKPEENLIEDLLLRSMMKARYSTNNVGHFGLAFKHYTHFTSPIRRYPDLAVHRLLKRYQDGFDFDDAKAMTTRLEHIAKVSSEREIVALEAERESTKMKQVEFMKRHLGDEFEGIISGVVPFGIFVELKDILVEGLVHISDLADDYYIHDEKTYRLIGQRTNNVYRLGDVISVRVVRVDQEARIIDFLLVE